MKILETLLAAAVLALPIPATALNMILGDVEVRNLGAYGFTAGNSFFATDAGTAGGPTDQLFQMFSYIANASGSTRADASAFNVSQAITQVGPGIAQSSIILNGAGAAALGLNAGDLEIGYSFELVDDTSPADQDFLRWRFSITNNSAAAISFSFYNYLDLDLGGAASFANDVAVGNLSTITVTDAGNPALPPYVWFSSMPATHFQIGAYPGLRNQLDGMAAAQNLTDGVANFGPADFTGAFQYDLTIAAGQTLAFATGVPEPGPGALLGLVAGLLGLHGHQRRRTA